MQSSTGAPSLASHDPLDGILLGKGSLRVRKLVGAAVLPPLLGIAAYWYLYSLEEAEELTAALKADITTALTAALTPLAVLLVYLLYQSATETKTVRPQEVAGGQVPEASSTAVRDSSSYAQTALQFVGFLAFAASISILIHLAAGDTTEEWPTPEVALVLTIGAFASVPAVPALVSLMSDPDPPANLLRRMTARALDAGLASLLVVAAWWPLSLELPDEPVDVLVYIGTAWLAIYMYEALLRPRGVTLGKLWRDVRIVSMRSGDEPSRVPSQVQNYHRSAALAASLAVPAGLVMWVLQDIDSGGVESETLWVEPAFYLNLIATLWLATVLIAPFANTRGRGIHDAVAETIAIDEQRLRPS